MPKGALSKRSYDPALVLSLMFQLSAWLMCFFNDCTYRYDSADLASPMVLNWRTWFISCGVYWLGFLVVFLTQRRRPAAWRRLYTGVAFPCLFIAAAFLVRRFYGAD